MTTLIDNAEYTTNEIYEIQALDAVEGAAVGASFGGVGISNQPHQQLANRTAYLYNQIRNLQGQLGALTSGSGQVGARGYLKLPISDSVRGKITLLVQWGSFVGNQNGAMRVAWPTPFPNACLWAIAGKSGAAVDVAVSSL